MKTLRQHLLGSASPHAMLVAQGGVDYAQVDRALTLAGVRMGFLRLVKVKGGYRAEETRAR